MQNAGHNIWLPNVNGLKRPRPVRVRVLRPTLLYFVFVRFQNNVTITRIVFLFLFLFLYFFHRQTMRSDVDIHNDVLFGHVDPFYTRVFALTRRCDNIHP